MSTAAVVHPSSAAQPAAQPNAFLRFIDVMGALWRRAEPVIKGVEGLAVALEPILAFTPAGPEYAIAVNAIVGAQQTAAAALTAGITLTTVQKAQIALNAATPALDTILAGKGITTGTQVHIESWIQNVFNILAGPVVTLATALLAGNISSGPVAGKSTSTPAS